MGFNVLIFVLHTIFFSMKICSVFYQDVNLWISPTHLINTSWYIHPTTQIARDDFFLSSLPFWKSLHFSLFCFVKYYSYYLQWNFFRTIYCQDVMYVLSSSLSLKVRCQRMMLKYLCDIFKANNNHANNICFI